MRAQGLLRQDDLSTPETFTKPSLVAGADHFHPRRSRKRQSQSVHAGSVHGTFARYSNLSSQSKKKPEKAVSKLVAQVRIRRWFIVGLLKELTSPSLCRPCLQKQIALYQMDQDLPDIDTRLPYRLGCPQLPALPLETEYFRAGDAIFPTWRASCDGVQDILRKHKISGYTQPAYRFHRETPAEKLPVWLILPDIDDTEDGINAWQKAAIDIWNYLQQQGLNLSVEILDINAYQGLKTMPILSTEVKLLEIWDSVMFRIAATVTQRGHNLKALDLVHRERRGLDASIATVAITAKDADNNEQWYTTVKVLYEFLPPSLRVEVRYGLNVLAHDPPNTSSKNVLSIAYYSANARMGGSCGRMSSPSSGSLGGLVRLEGVQENFALTNHHVMCGAINGHHEDLKQFLSNERPITPKDKIAKSQMIVANSPSDEDHETFLKTLISKRDKLVKEKPFELAILGPDHLHVKRLEEAIQQRTEDIRFAEQFSRRFGWLVASSGARCTPLPEVEYPNVSMRTSSQGLMGQWVLDWSLIQIDDDRRFVDVVTEPNQPRPIPARQYQSISRHKHYNVAKFGRISGWTHGIMSAAKSLQQYDLAPIDQPEIYPAVLDWNSEKGVKYPALAVAYTLVPKDGKSPFLEPGDSGSLVLLNQHTNEGTKDSVLDNEKSIIGLGFGQHPSFNLSYMTSMESVIKDIEEVTEKKVEQPSYAGVAPDTKQYRAED